MDAVAEIIRKRVGDMNDKQIRELINDLKMLLRVRAAKRRAAKAAKHLKLFKP